MLRLPFFLTALFAEPVQELESLLPDGWWPWSGNDPTGAPTAQPTLYTGKAYKKPIIFVNGLTESVLYVKDFTFPSYCIGVDHTKPIWPPQMELGAECILDILTLCKSNDDRIVESCYHGKPVDIYVPDGAAGTLGGPEIASSMYDQFGYVEGKDMKFFTYDWRFAGLASYMHADFARLKDMIKEMHDTYNQKVHLLSISLGGPFTNHFFNWVDAQDPTFLDTYVISHIAVSAAYMGSAQPLKSWVTPLTRFEEGTQTHDSWINSKFYDVLSYLNLDGIEVIRSMPAAVYLAPWINEIKEGWEDRVVAHDNKTHTDYHATRADYKKLIKAMRAGDKGGLDILDLILDPVIDLMLKEAVPVNIKPDTLCLGVERQNMAIGYVFADITDTTCAYDAIWGHGDEVVPDFGLKYCASNADKRNVKIYSFDLDDKIEGHVGIISDPLMWGKIKEHLDKYENFHAGHQIE